MTVFISKVRSSENHLIEMIDMSWESALKANIVQYSGTCRKCGEFVDRGDPCPLKLRSEREQGRQTDSCPMKV